MIQLNLLPDVKKEFLRAQAARRKTITVSILVTLAAIGATVAFAFYVYAVQNVILAVQTSDIKSKSHQLSSIKDIDKYLVIQGHLDALSELHNQKNNFSRLLDFLPHLNPAPPQNMTLASLDVDAGKNSLTLKGKVNEYGALTTLKDTLKHAEFTYQGEKKAQPLFSEVKITTATYSQTASSSGVSFTIEAIYNPDALVQKNIGVSVTVPNKETTQSVIDSPQAIFGGDNGNQ